MLKLVNVTSLQPQKNIEYIIYKWPNSKADITTAIIIKIYRLQKGSTPRDE